MADSPVRNLFRLVRQAPSGREPMEKRLEMRFLGSQLLGCQRSKLQTVLTER